MKPSKRSNKSSNKRSNKRSNKYFYGRSYKKSGGYSEKVTKLLLKAKDKRSREAARLTKTTELKCPSGLIKRRGYLRKDKKSGKVTAVGAKCIINRGKPGKGPRRILMKNDKGLGRYGYHNITTLTKKQREESLKQAVKAYGYVEVIRRVGAIATLLTRTKPILSKKIRSDQHMVSKWYDMAKKRGLKPTPI